jgi:hypothetical protein
VGLGYRVNKIDVVDKTDALTNLLQAPSPAPPGLIVTCENIVGKGHRVNSDYDKKMG